MEVLTEESKVSDGDGRSARKKLRDQIEAAMDDPTQWEDEPIPVPARRSEKRQRAAMVSVRFSSAELEAVQAEAHARGLTVSRYVRDRALEPTVSRPAQRARYYVVANGTSLDLTNVVVEPQTGSPTVPYVVAPGLALV